MSKPWQPYALHILDAIAKIARIRSRGDLTQDEVLYDAALRNLQTLSEATRLLPERKTSLCPSIPWREISGFRNVLVHNYLGDIDPATVLGFVAESKADKIYITYGAAHFPGFFAGFQKLDPGFSIRSIKGVRSMVLPDEPNLAPSAVSGSGEG